MRLLGTRMTAYYRTGKRPLRGKLGCLPARGKAEKMSIAGWLIRGLVLAGGISLAGQIIRVAKSANEELQKLDQLDYVPAEPDREAVRRVYSRTIAWQVGKVEVKGIENLDKCPQSEPLIIISNHSSYADPSVITCAIDRRIYWMTAIGVLKFAGGLSAHYLKGCGAVPIEIAGENANKALWRFSRLIAAGKTLALFPEGWIHLDGVTRDFKKGVILIARKSAKLLGRPVRILPIYVRYGKYPGSFVSNIGVPFDYLITLITGPLSRAGSTVYIGEPILSDALPSDSDAAIKLLHEKVIELNPEYLEQCDSKPGRAEYR
jgi:1-acyl-sn-glycerol-3-phosphate acyltransferase